MTDGDVFYSPDVFPRAVTEAAREGLYARWRSAGVRICFMVHDILPVLQPHCFPPGAEREFADWLRSVGKEADCLVCISAAVAEDPALVVALAHPERLARRRGPDSPVYLMAGGTAAELPPGSGLGDAEWLAVAEATRDPGRAHGIIRLAARADEELALHAAPNLVTDEDEVTWSGGDVVARRVRRLGAIALAERPLRDPDPALVRAALLTGLREDDVLTWNTEAERLRARLAFLHDALGAPCPRRRVRQRPLGGTRQACGVPLPGRRPGHRPRPPGRAPACRQACARVGGDRRRPG